MVLCAVLHICTSVCVVLHCRERCGLLGCFPTWGELSSAPCGQEQEVPAVLGRTPSGALVSGCGLFGAEGGCAGWEAAREVEGGAAECIPALPGSWERALPWYGLHGGAGVEERLQRKRTPLAQRRAKQCLQRAWILSLETRTPVRGRGVVTEQNRAFGNELGRSFRRSKGKKSSHHPSCFIAVHVNKLQAGGVCCRGEEALLPHEHMREGVFPTSVFVNTQLILSSTGCQRRSLESLPGLGLFALLCFRCKNHLELISTVKEVPRQFVGMAFLPGQPSLMTGLSKQLQQCKHLPLELSQLLDG